MLSYCSLGQKACFQNHLSQHALGRKKIAALSSMCTIRIRKGKRGRGEGGRLCNCSLCADAKFCV